MAAFALPTMATAETWTDEGEAIAADATIVDTGTYKINTAVGAIECQMTLEATLKGSSGTGEVKKFEVDLDEIGSTVTSKCKTAGGLAACGVHGLTPAGLPWTVHIKPGSIRVTHKGWNMSITGGFCPTSSVTVTEGEITATPDNPDAISSLTLSGTATVDSSLGTVQGTVSGSEQVLSPNTGTYGIT